jgi:hypothetical protein
MPRITRRKTNDDHLAELASLRSDVSRTRQAVLDKLATGAGPSSCEPFLERWRESVRTYLSSMGEASIDGINLKEREMQLCQRLETGFGLPEPDTSHESFKLDKHFEKLLAELEAVCDIQSGAEATRSWLLSQDYRLRQVIRRDGAQNEKRTTERRQGNQELPLDVPEQTRSAHYAS